MSTKSVPHAGPSSFSMSNNPVQTFVFLDIESSGLEHPKITELSMMAVSRYDLFKMQTKEMYTRREEQPEKMPKKTWWSKESSAVKLTVNHVVVYSQNRKEYSQVNERSTCAKRKLFSTPAKTATNGGLCEGELDYIISGSVSDHHNSTEDVLHCKKIKPSVVDAEVQCAPPSADKATDTTDLYPRRCLSQRYPVPAMPRIVNRYTRFFNPRRIIYTAPEEVSGLNNILLEHMLVIDEQFCESFKEFLRLPKPVCLIGHNADRFDFPAIVAEILHATNCNFDFEDVVCADSLIALRLLDNIEVHEEISTITSLLVTHSQWFSEDVVSGCTTNGDMQHLKLAGNTSGSVHVSRSEEYLLTEESVPSRAEDCETPSGPQCPRTPEHSAIISNGSVCQMTPTTPSTQTCYSKQNTPQTLACSTPVTPPASPRTPHKTLSNAYKTTCIRLKSAKNSADVLNSRIMKFPDGCSFKAKVEISQRHYEFGLGFRPYQKPFSQPTLYQRLFGRHYDAHRAEEDCKALLEICGHYGHQFAEVVDVICRPLSDVKPKWLTTKMIRSPYFKQSKYT